LNTELNLINGPDSHKLLKFCTKSTLAYHFCEGEYPKNSLILNIIVVIIVVS